LSRSLDLLASLTRTLRIPSKMFLKLFWPGVSDGSGSNFFDPGQVGSIFGGSGLVSHLWFGFEFRKFPLKTSDFSIFSLRVKKNLVGSESTRVEGGSAS